MIKLVDNRPNPYQWDTNAEVEFDGVCDQFHFANRVYGRSINVNAEQQDGKSKCLIPIQLLQTTNDLNVYVFVGTAESGQTKVEHTFKVIPRNKPNDYVFTPAEQMTIEEIEKIANDAMKIANNSMEVADNAITIAESVRDDADAGKFKGDKGDKGADGKDGASDYPLLTNKPQINGVTLEGNKTSADLKIGGGEVWEDIPLNQKGIITNGMLDVDTSILDFKLNKPYKKLRLTMVCRGNVKNEALTIDKLDYLGCAVNTDFAQGILGAFVLSERFDPNALSESMCVDAPHLAVLEITPIAKTFQSVFKRYSLSNIEYITNNLGNGYVTENMATKTRDPITFPDKQDLTAIMFGFFGNKGVSFKAGSQFILEGVAK